MYIAYPRKTVDQSLSFLQWNAHVQYIVARSIAERNQQTDMYVYIPSSQGWACGPSAFHSEFILICVGLLLCFFKKYIFF